MVTIPQEITDYLRAKGIRRYVLFGSQYRGHAGRYSDWDIAAENVPNEHASVYGNHVIDLHGVPNLLEWATYAGGGYLYEITDLTQFTFCSFYHSQIGDNSNG
jgi:predicted nucleotidyltransferase